MVITRVVKGKQYAGHWEQTKKSAHAFGKKMIKKGLIKRYVVTTKPKNNYKF